MTGHLEIRESEYEHQSIGDKNAAEKGHQSAVLVVVDPIFWVRVLFSYDIGCKYISKAFFGFKVLTYFFPLVSEAYMAGEFQTPDLKAVLNVSGRN